MNNKLLKHFLIIVVCYIIDSTISYLLPYNYAKQSITIIPYLGLIVFIKSVDYFEDADLFFFAAICSTYYSIIYANSLPIYILIYEIIAFARMYIIKLRELSLLEFEGLCCFYVFLNIIATYVVMCISNKTSISLYNLFLFRMLPTIGLSLVFGIITYNLFHYLESVHFVEKPENMFDQQ